VCVCVCVNGSLRHVEDFLYYGSLLVFNHSRRF
jgi:hypothetical protein